MSETAPTAFAITPLARPSTTPRELAVRSLTGNASATARLLKTVGPSITGAVRAILGAQHPDLDDAIQLALIGFMRALPGYRGECEPSGFARVIAVRAAITTRKKQRAAEALRNDDAEPDAIESARSSPHEVAAADRRRTVLRELLADLPTEQGETLALRVGLGWSIEEIARETDVPVNTVRSRLRLAKERLRARIEDDPRLRDVFDRT